MIITLLFVLGLIFGSFLNAMTWRIHAGTDWVKDRSRCDHCGHVLAASDLVPVFSWLALRGRCRYCKKRLSWQHPVVELATGLVFAASYYFWPTGIDNTGQWVLFITWLISAVGLMSLLIYDAKWMLLPNKLLYPVAAIAAMGRVAYILGFADNKLHALAMWALSVAVASGIFWLLFHISNGKWIGYGDVRLGLVTGTLLADPWLSFLMLFLSSVLGTLFVLPELLKRQKGITSKVPYGPFLIAATALSLLFGPSLIEWYKSFILP